MKVQVCLQIQGFYKERNNKLYNLVGVIKQNKRELA